MRFLAKQPTVQWMSLNRVYIAISAAMLVISVVSLFTRGINFGIDFAGGYELQVKFDKKVEEEKVQKVVESLGLGDSRVQRYGDASANEFLVLVRQESALTEEQRTQLKHDIEALAGGETGVGNFSVAESGENIIVGFTKPVTEEQLKGVLGKYALEVKRINAGERVDRPEYVVELISVADKVQGALVKAFEIPADHQLVQRTEFVGPQVGAQLRNQGILAVIYSMIFILFYIALRFDFFFAPGAVITLVHDAVIIMGFFSVFQIEFNLPIVAAILTLMGYSLNDTIVIFDRVRENMVRLRGRDLKALVDTSINETLARTLITSFATLAVVLAILIFGGTVTRDFALCMTVGIVLGSYSTIAVSAPLYVLFRQYVRGSAPSKKDAPSKSSVNGGQATASL
ncbi:MAG: protein translocase subunit SecF [Myxococcota bacterium]